MNFTGVMRIKNESRWIEQVVRSLQPLCQKVLVMDDHSTDNTVEICESIPNVTVFKSPFDTLDEARDKSWIMTKASELCSLDWIIMIDGDEVLESSGQDKIRALVEVPDVQIVSFKIAYLWNDVKTVRVDRVYSDFHRPSMYRVNNSQQPKWLCTGFGGNVHCGSVPLHMIGRRITVSDVTLWHYGYLDAEIRRRKYAWYNKVDPNNQAEDCYRHIIQGDVDGPRANEILKHAGPLVLKLISD